MSEIELHQCFNKQQRDFLVSLTVHKARNLNVFNADTFVEITFNDEVKRTRTYQNSDCPFFNEYFVFELRTSLESLLKKNIHLAVVQDSHFLKRNSIVGELNVNLCTIWKQDYHTFVRKWGVLEKIGSDHKNATAGYLQVDLAIVTTSDPPAPSVLHSYDDDIIEDNLLHPSTTPCDPESVKYLVNIFDGSFTVKRDYIVQVTYGSFRTRTRQIKYAKYCKWNEQLVFHGKFQSLNQMMIFELLVQDYYQWRVKCAIELNFSDMCWSINNMPSNKPSFGPAHITFYEGAQRNAYYGKLLVSIATEDVDEKMTVSSLQKKQDIIMPLNESEFWNEEIFKINMIVLSVDAVDVQHGSVKAFLTCEDVMSNVIELSLREYKLNKLKLKFAEFSSNIRPVMSMSIKLHDNRLKNQANNLMKMLSREMESNIRSFKLFEARHFDNEDHQVRCLKMLHGDLKSMLEGLKIKTYAKTFKKLTDWDSGFMKFLQFTLDKCIDTINSTLSNSNNGKSALFQEYLNIRDVLLTSINEVNIAPADVMLNVTKDSKLLAFHRFSTFDYVHSQAFDSRGQFCGKMKSIVVKPATCMHSCETCGCMFGKVEIILWIGSDKEVSEWLPQGALEMAASKVNFTAERYCKCNVYVHQAKIQPGIDRRGDLWHPKLVVLANGISERTRVISQPLSIVWNEVLTMENVKLFDIGDGKCCDYPSITMYLFDEDKRKLDFIGCASINVPVIKTSDEKIPQGDIRKLFHQLITQSPPQLRWVTLHKNGIAVAEVLMSAELIPLTAPTITIQERDTNDSIPVEISPSIRKFHIEVTFVGLRHAPKHSNFASSRFKIELSMGELLLVSSFAAKGYKRNVNLLDPYCSGYILLPEQFQYWPPIIIKHLDCHHKHCETIGAAMIRRPEKFFVEDKPKQLQRFLLNDPEDKTEETIEVADETAPLLGKASANDSFANLKRALNRCKLPKFLQMTCQSSQMRAIILEHEYTWWTKFYNSNREEELQNESLHSLKVFHSELEKQSEYEYLTEWAHPIDMYRGKGDKDKGLRGEKYAQLKCSIKILKCWGKEFFETEKTNLVPSNFRFKRIPNLQVELPILLRVYIVQALNLRSHDVYSHSDAFIKIDFGNQTLSDRAHYIPNQYSPLFGKRYQVSGVVPRDTRLKISIYDRDTLSNDDLIGKTKIDIEDRLRTKYGAACGLMREYNSSGYNAWRHSQLPSEILAKLCGENELALPQYFPTHALLAGIEFSDVSKVTKDGNMKERLALTMLHNFHKIPGIGHHLVPEHVETRSLHRKDRPGVEQGKLLMWIEIYDPRRTIPEPVDVTPVPPRTFELRVIIWNAKDVILNDKNIFGKSMSDIYIKGWMESVELAQFTDVHYRSLSGEGNFNWRMIFSFKYSIGEDMMIITKKKNPFEKFDTEIKIPAVLSLQIWDNDTFSPDDFLGAVAINLSHFPQLALSPEKCSLRKGSAFDNLFAVDGSLRGWCAVHGKEEKHGPIKGKLELELEVLSEEKAKANPAGKGRDGPNKLGNPIRPDTSFNWYESPGMSLKHIVWPLAKKLSVSLGVILAIIVVVMIVMAVIYEIPQALMKKALN